MYVCMYVLCGALRTLPFKNSWDAELADIKSWQTRTARSTFTRMAELARTAHRLTHPQRPKEPARVERVLSPCGVGEAGVPLLITGLEDVTYIAKIIII